ncbi:MAG: bifunctional diaminohydroxyphosphoribosylaminopyrimidine deaminase/5-amino-6-(5-phosphoribosylamino)uracil reductase RibD [Betaproteobacteria bacterium]|nr:bifunctional diaminohydroxyphosphoribosylaminopyrimidine deaminase/5-amino-6-(5-phosphoribosylamino)uracil reductase RibD [Betaproteobacteria bacterium]
MSFTGDDRSHMARALELAALGMNTTSPNPRVGCVLVRDGATVGEGWHARAGEPHAEVHALAAAGDRAAGATAYVSLEPCSHHGRTPPCADALIRAGVRRVVAAMEDPNPRVRGQGLARLREAGMETDCGLLEDEARELNIGFVARMTRGRPWLRVKIAASLDGKTALPNGASQWITGPEARRDGHAWRARSCVVMTGIGTLRDDDPRLTVRDVPVQRQPVRLVVDSRLRIPLDAKILDGGSLIVATATDDAEKVAQLAERNAEVWVLPDSTGKVDLPSLMQRLGERQVNEVLGEAGINLHSALWAAGVVDELVLYQAPRLLGDAARGMLRLAPGELVDDMPQLDVRDISRYGDDLRIIARPRRRSSHST